MQLLQNTNPHSLQFSFRPSSENFLRHARHSLARAASSLKTAAIVAQTQITTCARLCGMSRNQIRYRDTTARQLSYYL
jgi:hypothetical protein